MKLSIFQKLALALVGLTGIILFATLGLARWSFEKGFLEYVNAVEHVRLNEIVSELEPHYVGAGNSWSGLSEVQFIGVLSRFAPRPPGLLRPLGPGRPRNPSSSKSELIREEVNALGADKNARVMRNRGSLGEPLTMNRRTRLGPPTALFNLQGERVVGVEMKRSLGSSTKVDIVYDGKKVGELVTLTRRSLESPQETQFAKQQLQTSMVIGVMAICLATMLSLLIARAMLGPLKKMIRSVNTLSNGDYTVRTEETRSDELGDLMRNFDRLASILEKNLSSRRRTLADISHELRTPLTVLSCELEALKDGVRPFDEKQVLSLDQEVQRLKNLVDDLYQLSLSDIGGLRYEFQPLDFNAFAIGVTSRFTDRAAVQGIVMSVRGEPGLVINGDEKRLDQLINNLIENSLAYTNQPGEIIVIIARLGTEVCMEIIDTPPGVEQSECDQLFEPLYRQDGSRNRRTAGAGLGLAICRNIVDAHGGTVDAKPSNLGGLHIIIKLPEFKEAS